MQGVSATLSPGGTNEFGNTLFGTEEQLRRGSRLEVMSIHWATLPAHCTRDGAATLVRAAAAAAAPCVQRAPCISDCTTTVLVRSPAVSCAYPRCLSV